MMAENKVHFSKLSEDFSSDFQNFMRAQVAARRGAEGAGPGREVQRLPSGDSVFADGDPAEHDRAMHIVTPGGARVRPYCRFVNRATKSLQKSGIKRISSRTLGGVRPACGGLPGTGPYLRPASRPRTPGDLMYEGAATPYKWADGVHDPSSLPLKLRSTDGPGPRGAEKCP